MKAPTIEDVERISSIKDDVIRNLNITQCYCELSDSMRKLIGVSPNWCTFAVWASKQAGQSIRREDLKDNFEYYFRNSSEILFLLKNFSAVISKLPEVEELKESLLKIIDIDSVFERSGKAVATGNKKVFEEIGKEFARFLEYFNENKKLSVENIKKFCSFLKPGEPPEGQQLLIDAFSAYFEAYLLSDSKAKCELIFYANLLIGFHEQTRLQPDIVEAMNSGINKNEIRNKILSHLLPGFWLRVRYYISKIFKRKLPLDEAIDQLIDLITKKIRELITINMMSLNLPGNIIRLGRNLAGNFPESLSVIINNNLKELLLKIDPTPDSLNESGAEDWGDLKDRIHFIADFFRSYHEHQSLLETPFTEEQIVLIKSGNFPAGSL